MANRPTPEQVQRLLSVTFSTEELEDAISDAGLMLNACAKLYDDERQAALVKYLAAHLLASSQVGAAGSLASESVDGTSYSRATATLGQNLKGTTFGQQALLLDPNGCLQSLGEMNARLWVV